MILAAEPAATQHQPGEEFAQTPELRLTAFWGEPIEREHQPTRLLGCLGQALALLLFVTGQQREKDLVIECRTCEAEIAT